ncbi:KR domain-containing protein [Aspergillus luchuensis IFO 4308]|nr:KR domain-containing protein [Aspergillus luchuensis IFO 4308]
MAARLPGGISNDKELWDFLLAKRDARSRVPSTRFELSAHLSESGKPGTTKTEHGYFLDESVDLGTLDTTFFSFTKHELEYIDPQQRQLLEVVRECFDSAGEVNYRGRDIGCFGASFGDDWFENMSRDEQMYGKYPLMVSGDFAIPNRVSYEYDLHGPSVSVRTACSSSLVALHQACLSIERGECSAAIVAGYNILLSPTMTLVMSAKGVLSPDGSCKSFDASADGYGRGEAVNAVYIKPLNDALREGNPIRAVIRGSAVNSDGKNAGFTVPSGSAQQDVIRKAYHVAGISDLSRTGFVECHGTGTSVGDPIEVLAIAESFGDQGMYIGSVKPNVGHSEGASGLTSLIKAVLAIEHRIIPPNIKFNTPNPRIPFAAKKIKVPVDATPWPEDRCLRASVNSFGMGGVNAHVVIESADSFTPPSSPLLEEGVPVPRLLFFSANTETSLDAMIEHNLAYLTSHPGSLRDLAYTLGARREHLPLRAASIIHSDMSATTTSFGKAPLVSPDIVMVFAGQGSQWPAMGFELYKCNATFRESLLQLDGFLHNLPDAPSWSIIEEISKDDVASNLHISSYSQPVCTAIQIALVDVLFKLNTVPHAVLGHSSGELAAAYAAGKVTAGQALISAFYRGVAAQKVTKIGFMAAVGMGIDETRPFLRPGVVIACENSPSSVTLSGDSDELQHVIQAIRMSRPDVLVRELKSDTAYHSGHMKAVGDAYHSLIEPFFADTPDPKSSRAHFYSTLEGDILPEGTTIGSKYWQSNLESPVLFHKALQKLVIGRSNRQLLFLEVSPHSTLAGPIRQTLDKAQMSHKYISCLICKRNCAESFLSALGQLYSQKCPLDFDALTNPDQKAKVLTDIPTYPWQHNYSSLYQPRHNKDWRFRKQQRHELLGIRVVDTTNNDPSWRNMIYPEQVPWLLDHRVSGNIVFPAAGYIMMAVEAVQQIAPIGIAGFVVRNMFLDTAMILIESIPTEIVTSLRRHRLENRWSFAISSHNGTSWIEHCSGEVARGHSLSQAESRHQNTLPRVVDLPSWYRTLSRGGLHFGSSFQGIENISCSTTTNLASGKVVSTLHDSTYYPIHPTKLDAFLHSVYCAVYKGFDWQVEMLPVPTSIAEINIIDCASDLAVTSWADVSKKDMIHVHAEAFGSDGALVLKVHEAILRPLGANQSEFSEDDRKHGARLVWRPSIQFLNLTDMIHTPPDWAAQTMLLNCLTSKCVEEALSRLEAEEVSSSTLHLRKYQNWLRQQPKTTSRQNIDCLVQQILETSAAPCARAMVKVLDNVVPICKGEIEALEVLMSDDTLTDIYNYVNQVDRAPFLNSLGHYQPQQRILEIGAGTGGTTAKVLSQTRYSTYTFTDISAAFFPAAKERFKTHQNMTFKALDISQDPLSQGFEPQSFDLIIAANVLHATPFLHQTLTNVRKLLHPQGKLLLEEVCGEAKFSNFITGLLPGWWAGEADGRPDEPYISPDRWEKVLRASGFNGLDDVAFDASPPLHNSAFMLASPCFPETPTNRHVTLITDTASSEISIQMQKQFRFRGYTVGIQGLEEPLPGGGDALVLLDTASPFFENLNANKLSTFQSFLRELQRSHSGALWATRSIQIGCTDPRFACTVGVARTVRSEFGIDLATCEVDTLKYTSLGLLIDVFEQFHNREHRQDAYREFELGERDHLLDDEIEIEVNAAGVNFKTVLIHAGSGGIGLAAIQISQMIGATIYVTVGNEAKAEYLTTFHGIYREHIFNSRDSSFLDGVMRSTNGRGVDLVLNSLSGDLFQASCQCVAKCGKLVNLAKSSDLNHGQLSTKAFHPNMAYSVIDILDYIDCKPEEGKRLLGTIVDLYKEGHIRPITPVQTFVADDIKQCFVYMQTGQHIGKLRLSMKSQDTPIKPVFVPKTMSFRGNASYLLVGGLGGLGSGIARWMVEHGARHLIFLSRSANSEHSNQLFSELESQGCSITAVKGSVCVLADVKRAISSTTNLKGIFNISMVLQDTSLLHMSLDDWNAATGPKIQGTWNLHEASVCHDLDFFLLFSSMGGIFGIPGQANYAAANTFMDAFVQFRHCSRLPASVIDIGAVESIGHVASNPDILEQVKVLDCCRMTQRDLFNAVTIAISHSLPAHDNDSDSYSNPAQFITGFKDTSSILDSSSGQAAFSDSRLAPFVSNAADSRPISEKASTDKLKQFVSLAASDPLILTEPTATEFVGKEISKWVFDLLMKPVEDDSEIDLARSLVDVGLDSLAAVEMRSWLKASLGVDVSVLEIMAFPSLAAMGEHVVHALIRKFGNKE